ncbi:MAG: hypothetical protein NPIRA05_16450 [Nitrospirales bacterium]|nr:MAG: hypothetical protein NPIRA05_16450 [Nitrospirales bacterium]
MSKPLLFFTALLAMSALWVYSTQPPPSTPLPDDPKALEALERVKTHGSRDSTTIEESLNKVIHEIESLGHPIRVGGWRVAMAGEKEKETYVVSRLIREKGETGWIERDFAWRVNLKEKWIKVVTLAAGSIMPLHELAPLPHSDEVS